MSRRKLKRTIPASRPRRSAASPKSLPKPRTLRQPRAPRPSLKSLRHTIRRVSSPIWEFPERVSRPRSPRPQNLHRIRPRRRTRKHRRKLRAVRPWISPNPNWPPRQKRIPPVRPLTLPKKPQRVHPLSRHKHHPLAELGPEPSPGYSDGMPQEQASGDVPTEEPAPENDQGPPSWAGGPGENPDAGPPSDETEQPDLATDDGSDDTPETGYPEDQPLKARHPGPAALAAAQRATRTPRMKANLTTEIRRNLKKNKSPAGIKARRPGPVVPVATRRAAKTPETSNNPR